MIYCGLCGGRVHLTGSCKACKKIGASIERMVSIREPKKPPHRCGRICRDHGACVMKEADCEQCGRATTRRIDGLAVCTTCVPEEA